MNRKQFVIAGIAILSAILLGYVDLHAKEVQGTVLVLLILTFIFGFLEPRRAWLWALILGLSIYAAYIIGPMLGVYPWETPKPPYAPLIALIPAFIGAYAGAFTSRLIHSSSPNNLTQ